MTPEQETYLTQIAAGLMALGYDAEDVVAVLATAGPQLKLRELEFQMQKIAEARAEANSAFDTQQAQLQAHIDALAAQIRQGL